MSTKKLPKKLKRSIIQLTVAATSLLVVAICFISGVFGWFTSNNETETALPSLQVQGMDVVEDVIDANLFDTATSTELERAYLFPGESISVKVVITNKVAESRNFVVSFGKFTVFFPNIDSDENWESYYTGDHYIDKSAGNKLSAEAISETMNAERFKSFVSPVTNAIKYEMYTTPRSTLFGNDYSGKNRFTSYAVQGNATAAELLAGKREIEFGDSNPSPEVDICTVSGAEGSETMTSSDYITIAGGEDATLYFVIYFDPETYSSASLSFADGSTRTVELQNSNCYLNQIVNIEFGLITVE